MKLDNKGWGLSTLLICFCIILFFLIISVYYAHTFSTKIDNEQNESEELNNNYYKGYEGANEIQFICKKAGKIYILVIWEGFFDEIMTKILPEENGWTGLGY